MAAQPAATATASKSTRSVAAAKPSDKATEKATEKEAAGAKSSDKPAKTEKEAKKRPFAIVGDEKQCGLPKDGEWYEHVPEQRIRVSQATPEEAAMYQRIIDICLHPDTVYGKRVDFDINDVMAVMIEVQPYLASEPVLIEDVPYGITIVGDTHGQLFDVDRIFNIFAKDGKPGYLCSKFLFMGDYVDRGLQSLEVIMLLFCLKMLYPDNFILLRGNHEFVNINKQYGFGKECYDRYCAETYCNVFAQCNETFMYLSLAAIVGDSLFCVHAGVSSRQFNRHQLRGLYKPIASSNEDFLIQDMLWSDPAVGLTGTVFNYVRGNSHHFGCDTLVRALHEVGCRALVRGHTVMKHGFENLWDICYTVFSSTSYKNDAAVVYVDEKGRMHKYLILKCPERIKLLGNLIPEEEKTQADEEHGDGQSVNLSVEK